MRALYLFILFCLPQIDANAQMRVAPDYRHIDNWSDWALLRNDAKLNIYYRVKLCAFTNEKTGCLLHNAEIEFKNMGEPKGFAVTADLDVERPKCNGSDAVERVKMMSRLAFTPQKQVVSCSKPFMKIRGLVLKDVMK